MLCSEESELCMTGTDVHIQFVFTVVTAFVEKLTLEHANVDLSDSFTFAQEFRVPAGRRAFILRWENEEKPTRFRMPSTLQR